MSRGTIVPSKFVAGIRATPSEKPHAPGDRAVHERTLSLVPYRIGSDTQRCCCCIDERIRGINNDAIGDRLSLPLSTREDWRKILRGPRVTLDEVLDSQILRRIRHENT